MDLLMDNPLWQVLAESPTILAVVVGLLGLLVGSFLNVVIWRLPVMMKREWEANCRETMEEMDPTFLSATTPSAPERFDLLFPRSKCPKCGHMITSMENIPVISYLFLKGRCRRCKTPISKRYPLIEMFTAALSVLVAIHFGFTWALPPALLFTWSLIALSFIDFDEQLLPDSITLPMLWLGLLLSLGTVFPGVDPATSILGATAGYLSLWSVYKLFKLLTGKEGMGYGDFKLLAMLGAWTGWRYLILIILLSSIVGVIIQVTLIKFNRGERDVPFSFGPYLALAGFIAFLWGEPILTYYNSLFQF